MIRTPLVKSLSYRKLMGYPAHSFRFCDDFSESEIKPEIENTTVAAPLSEEQVALDHPCDEVYEDEEEIVKQEEEVDNNEEQGGSSDDEEFEEDPYWPAMAPEKLEVYLRHYEGQERKHDEDEIIETEEGQGRSYDEDEVQIVAEEEDEEVNSGEKEGSYDDEEDEESEMVEEPKEEFNNEEQGYDEDEIVDEDEEISDEDEDEDSSYSEGEYSKSYFVCRFCDSEAIEPVVTVSGHLYCQPCLSMWLLRLNHDDCFVCDTHIKESTATPIDNSESKKRGSPMKFDEIRVSIKRRRLSRLSL